MSGKQLQLLDLAADILVNAKTITDKLRSAGYAEPTFEVDTPRDLWEDTSLELDATKSSLIEAALTLINLVNGPMLFIRELFGSHFDIAAFQVIIECKVVDSIPLDGSISISDLSQAVKIDEQRLSRMIRLLTTQHFIKEISENVFAHTFVSALLVRDKELRAQVEMQFDEMHKASVETADYFKACGSSKQSHDSPFKFKWGKPFYEWYEDHPAKAVRFADAQEGIAKFDRDATSIFNWVRDEAKEPTTIIDVGGGSGHIALDLARKFQHLKFVVQDLSENMFSETSKGADLDLLARVSFAKHDFFEPQPIDSAVSAYLLRSCLHNWGDDEAVKIIRGFLPAMQANPRLTLLINESVIPEPGTINLHEERKLRQGDVAMLVIANAKQRSEGDWKALVRIADGKLKVVRILRDKGTMGLIEVRLADD